MANRDRVKLAFIHVPDEGSGAVGGRQVQGLGRVRGWMTPGQAGWHWHWQVVCRWVCLAGRQTGTGLAGLEAALARGMAGQQRRRRQASSSSSAAAAEGSAHYSHDRAQTAQPEDLGRDAGGGGAGVRGWWMGDGVQHKPTWVRRLPPIRVGWCGGSRDVCTRVPYLRANSI